MKDLEPPGAGLPGLERSVLSGLLRLRSWLTSDDTALLIFENEADRLLVLVESCDLIEISEQVLVGRLAGLEDSSRYWSVLMVLEHLRLVNQDILKIVQSLERGIELHGLLAIEFYKPEVELDLDTVPQFKNVYYDYVETVRALGQLASTSVYEHPWFGKLNAHQWNMLAALHMRIHRRQAESIVAAMGTV